MLTKLLRGLDGFDGDDKWVGASACACGVYVLHCAEGLGAQRW
jgi:hypothetical protein